MLPSASGRNSAHEHKTLYSAASYFLLSLVVCSTAHAGRGKWTTPSSFWGGGYSYAVHMMLLPGDDNPYHSRILWFFGETDGVFHGGQRGWLAGSDQCAAFPNGNFVNLGVPPCSMHVFCSGHAALADGRILTAGGTPSWFSGTGGEKGSRVFTRGSGTLPGSWSNPGPMNDWRWYPTATTLRDGRVLVTGGVRYHHHRIFGGRRNGAPPSSPVGNMLHSFLPVPGGQWGPDILPDADPDHGRPPSLVGHSVVDMTNVPEFGRHVYFGGRDSSGTVSNATWFMGREDNRTGADYRYFWSEPPVTGDLPVRRSDQAAVSVLGMLVIFGGLNSSNQALNDVHRLKKVIGSHEWRSMTISGTPPPARFGHAAVYDKRTLNPGGPVERMIVFGGVPHPDSTPRDLRIWELRFNPGSPDNARWYEMTQKPPVGGPAPAPRYWHSMVPAGESTLVLFGGALGNGAYSDTVWALKIYSDGEVGWEVRSSSGTRPSPRARHSAVYEPQAYGRLYVFGGEGAQPADRYVYMIEPFGPQQWQQWAEGSHSLSGHSLIPDLNGTLSRITEVFDPIQSSWTNLLKPMYWPYTYPVNFVVPGGTAPGGRVVTVGQDSAAYWVDISSTEGWQRLPNGNSGFRPLTGVTYRPGRIMIAGGYELNSSISGTTKTLDASNMNNQWITSGSMIARDDHNLVVLPDGKVIAIGGKIDEATFVLQPQIWDPVANGGLGAWDSDLEVQPSSRGYHSTAILLPDGRVLSSGGDGSVNKYRAELFCPPYLFRDSTNATLATRPTMSSRPPASLDWGTTFTVCVGDTTGITRVCMIRSGATTHGFDQNQRYVPLTFSKAGNPARLLVNSPATADEAPPGYYMLFVVGSPLPDGGPDTPSLARWVRMGTSDVDSCDTVKPAVMSLAADIVTSSSVFLSWSAPADDTLLAASGGVQAFDLRRRTSTITSEASWNGATQLSGEPAPGPVFSDASYNATGLASCTWYHFAVRSLDDKPQLSLLHDQFKVRTLGFGCGGGGFRVAGADGRVLAGAAPEHTIRPATTATLRGSTASQGLASASGSRLLVETRRLSEVGWDVVVRREADVAGVDPSDADAVVVQERKAGIWTTRHRLGAESETVGLCALREAGRIVLPAHCTLLEVAPTVHSENRDLALIEARHSRDGRIDGAALDQVALLAGDSLTFTYAATVPATESDEAHSWFLLIEAGNPPSTIPRESTEQAMALPTRFALHPSRPNPFGGSTRIAFDLALAQRTRLEILDLQGRVVRILVDGDLPPGAHTADWDGRDARGRRVGAGVYVYRLITDAFRDRRKLNLLP